MMIHRKLLWIWGTLSLSACATTKASEDTEVSYASDAQENLRLGDEALKGGSYVEAEKYFEYVRSKYPFLEASKTAALRRADVDFEQEHYLEARDRYQAFVKQYPTHAQVDYAAFRAAYTHYKEIPQSLFFMPNPREKEQTEVKNTLLAMTEFVRLYPESSLVAEAQKRIHDVRFRLADHEWYVAEFYRHRNKFPAVVGRLKTLLDLYPNMGFEPKALWGLYEAYQKLNDLEKAKGVLEEIQKKLPGTPDAAQAAKLLASS